MRYIGAIVFSLLVCGCNQPAHNQEVTQMVNYTKDHRTELCFASLNLSSQYALFTNVPCSPKVEAEIAKIPSGGN